MAEIIQSVLKNHCDELSNPVLYIYVFKDDFIEECATRNTFSKEQFWDLETLKFLWLQDFIGSKSQLGNLEKERKSVKRHLVYSTVQGGFYISSQTSNPLSFLYNLFWIEHLQMTFCVVPFLPLQRREAVLCCKACCTTISKSIMCYKYI